MNIRVSLVSIYCLSIAFVTLTLLAVIMWFQPRTVFLVLRYDPPSGKFRYMEYRDKDYEQYQTVGWPSPTQLRALYYKHIPAGEESFRKALQDEYWEFVSTGNFKGVGYRRHPLFAVSTIGAIGSLCGLAATLFFRRKMEATH